MQVSSLHGARPRFTWKTTPAGRGPRAGDAESGRRATQGARHPGTGRAARGVKEGPDADTTVNGKVS